MFAFDRKITQNPENLENMPRIRGAKYIILACIKQRLKLHKYENKIKLNLVVTSGIKKWHFRAVHLLSCDAI